MSCTRMRWPAMQGRPPHTPGVLVICCAMTFSMAGESGLGVQGSGFITAERDAYCDSILPDVPGEGG